MSKLQYAITSQFVRNYWKQHPFSLNSLVFMDVCESNGLSAQQDFVRACFEAQASVYVGWAAADTDKKASVGDILSANTVRLIFDRLLGVNQFDPATGLPQRPFDF